MVHSTQVLRVNDDGHFTELFSSHLFNNSPNAVKSQAHSSNGGTDKNALHHVDAGDGKTPIVLLIVIIFICWFEDVGILLISSW